MPDISALTPAKPPGRFRADASPVASTDHEREFRRWAYRRDGSFERAKLEEALVRALPPQLLRLKGSCRLTGEDGAFVLQMADGRWSLTSAEASPDQSAILLTGVGTADLPPSSVLDGILDAALAASNEATSGIDPVLPHPTLRR